MSWAAVRGRATALQRRYQALTELLGNNSDLLELMADLEASLRFLPPADPLIRAHVLTLCDRTLLQAETLNVLSRGRFRGLYEAHRQVEAELRAQLRAARGQVDPDAFWLPLGQCDRQVEGLVGGKAARLGELSGSLPANVPAGFVICTRAYAHFLSERRLAVKLLELLRDLDVVSDEASFRHRVAESRELVLSQPVPDEVIDAIDRGTEAVQSALAVGTPPARWAVRSSAVGEDGRASFAGQFESVLDVAPEGLAQAWLQVVASRFDESALRYRIAAGLSEVATPMAVLFIPMVDARCAGALCTRDPAAPQDDVLLLSAVRGVAHELVGGTADGETRRLSREDPSVVLESRTEQPQTLTDADAEAVARLGLAVEAQIGEAVEIEWAIGRDAQTEDVTLLQARPLPDAALQATSDDGQAAGAGEGPSALASGGVTICPGRGCGVVQVLADEERPSLPARPAAAEAEAGGPAAAVVLVVRQARPQLGSLLPELAGLVAEHGSPLGHLAWLAREFAVPTVFGMPDAMAKLEPGTLVGLDATRRQVHEGCPWPVAAVRRRPERGGRPPRAGRPDPIAELTLTLHLIDPLASTFRPRGCRSLHDIVRFCHEKGVSTMFELGDQQADCAGGAVARRLRVPDRAMGLNLWVLDLGGGVASGAVAAEAELDPDAVVSVPFQALWRGMRTPGVTWSGRRNVQMGGFGSVLLDSTATQAAHGRPLGSANYAIVAADYLNLNARLAYHYAMIDAVVGESAESNYVNFRFRGGGAGRGQRNLRTLFLAEVLRTLHFGVDRRGDLVTAWRRSAPQQASEDALVALGKLMGCARQLDMVLRSESMVHDAVRRFVAGDYATFG